MGMHKGIGLGLLPLMAVIAACTGDYSGDVAGGDTDGGAGGSGGKFASPEQFFTERLQPRLEFCRNCHVSGGIADVDDGRLFMLGVAADDLAMLRAAWESLGGNTNPPSRILRMASGTDARSHSGGTPWPEGSPPYQDMAVMLQCFSDPTGCLAQASASEPPPELALLGSSRGGHLWADYCEGKPDGEPLPPDPRSLVRPGVNEGKAVYFNAWWQTCRPGAYPATCGAYRQHVERGNTLLAGNGALGAGHEFGGAAPDSRYAVSAASYGNLWQKWSLTSRPADFDQLVEERYGLTLGAVRNPYPLPGEDPNATGGGSGQLPMALTQLRNADGSWTGRLGVTCHVCHSGRVGSPADGPGLGAVYGSNSLHDITVFFRELGGANSGFSIASLTRVRGTGNITNFQLFALVEGPDPTTMSGISPLILAAPSTGTENTPAWWNAGHRPLKFFEGGLPMDATRLELSWFYPGAPFANEASKEFVLAHEQDSTSWLASLKSPAYPLPVDTTLAEAGAILFHNKNLWAPELGNPAPPPRGGNGSCASCHGAYSPRYVHDPAFLDTPLLEGMAAYVVPLDLIGTDSRRLDGNDDSIVASSRNAWFAYRDVPECGNQNDPALRGDRELGYLAPPLYGVWATAPYFHNGSVPNVWELLKPSDRPSLWRRVSKPARAGVVMGFDADLGRAYDAEKMGWRYESLACGAGTLPYLECDPADPAADPLAQQVLTEFYANGGLLWNFANLPVLTHEQIEQRKIYNTHMYSQSNTGHEFTSVLADAERRALIEYLKTL
jgi:mono/diheme cytochrome c family protein